MKYSIKFKLFSIMGGIILFFVVASWLSNNLFLEKFYFSNKKIVLTDSLNKIKELYKDQSKDTSLELEKLENSKGLRIIIFDKDLNIIYNSRQKEPVVKDRPMLRPFENIRNIPADITKSKLSKVTDSAPYIEKRIDDRLNLNFISLIAHISGNDYVLISTPVAAIQENVSIANKFFIITGVITLLIGSILIFIIASKFSKPILELDDIARGMATLDFSKRYQVKTRDEIGTLGNSINSLSEQLQKSIEKLTQANEKLKHDIERERKIDEMRKEFISSVSHELKTPIALIQGYAEGLKINVNEDEENKNYYCDVIIDESFKMNKLVRSLLDLAQIESGEMRIDKVSFDMNELVDQVIKKNKIILDDKKIKVEVNNLTGANVYADYDRIEQIFTNYLSNAINHVDSNRFISVSIAEHQEKIRVSVFNTGKHIPKDDIDKIWTSFYKVDKARTRSYGGTGLGLTVVKAIQEAHKNDYGVKNVDKGVEFWFDIDKDDLSNEV